MRFSAYLGFINFSSVIENIVAFKAFEAGNVDRLFRGVPSVSVEIR